MAVVPAWCPNCNKMVGGSGIRIVGVGGEPAVGTLSGNAGARCPHCRTPTRILEGEFRFGEEIIDVIRASPWTRAKLAEYQSAVEWAAENIDTKPAEALQRLRQADPKTAAIVKKGLGSFTHARLKKMLTALALVIAEAVAAAATATVVTNYLNDDEPVSGQDIVPYFYSDATFCREWNITPQPASNPPPPPSSEESPPPEPRKPTEPPPDTPTT